MKKTFLLILLSFLMSAASFAQILQNSPGARISLQNEASQLTVPAAKGGGDIIWQTTFNWANPADPRGWSLPDGWEIKDNLDLGNLWVWIKDTVKGQFTNERAPSYFATRSDGFIAVPMDGYNFRDGISTNNPSDTYIMTPLINCSNAPSVVIKLNQYYRFCCENNNTGHLELMVTNDNGSHWATYDLSYGIGHNTFTPVKYRSPEINISDVAAGMPNVRIKIYFHEVPYYFWAIDDLMLTEAFDNDLVLEDSWSEVNMGFDSPIGHTNYIPFTQMGMNSTVAGKIGDYQFRGAMLNSGVADAEDARLNVKALKNGTQVYTGNSPVSTIWTIERDTLNTTDVFSPDGYGDYRFDLTASSANGEDKPVNNSASYFFTVNDTLYQRSDMSAESGTYTGVWANGNTGGDLLSVRYDIQTPCEVNSISAYLYSFTQSINPTFQFVLLKYMAEDDAYNELTTTDIVPMDSSKLGWTTLPLVKDGESEFLEPGTYYAAWRAWSDDGKVGMRLGWDMNDRAEFTGYSLIYLTSIATWYSSDKLPMMGMNLNAAGGPTEASVTFNVDMTKHITSGEFNPGTDAVDVTGLAASWNGTAAMTDTDGDGIYTATVDGLAVAGMLNYKYRINGTPEAYPLTGDPFRKYKVRYWNVLNNTFNGGVTTGVDQNSLVAAFSVYPNPTSGAFTVAVTNTTAADLVVTLTNIQGQVIYRNRVANTVNYQETIDPGLSKGVYFLSVNNGKEVKVQKVVVQ
ncbi:MAG: T9SS type A sorting domain-containing protein [Bacteroidales bacterium]|jgi:hypothetical protein